MKKDTNRRLSWQSFSFTWREKQKERMCLKLLQKNFEGPLILGYLHDIVKRLVDRDGVLFSPEKGIPKRRLSPFFGGLYLMPLDEVFSSGSLLF